MGRFATTVPLYEKFRPPYPAEFFRTVSRRAGLRKEHRLIDLGTGPGLLALGFAPVTSAVSSKSIRSRQCSLPPGKRPPALRRISP